MTRRELTCEEVIEQLFDYLDREVSSQHRADIERHLERCRDCFSRAEFEKRLRAKVEKSVSVQAPQRLRRRVKDLLDRFDTDETNSTN
ncbi:hypothetical protein L861_11025 [Litchfieldella anticariensis FP35 = DSM 16096]|uniref:Putative zinc-finger domain-containing protein n=1 Tax=Litchfieldella anticariensis (strain DSM 16096 / CECT 5854 / CIP 108499 / LMG 22089 / FP35) TaxID=1121939 RepID=S2KKY6_LITA3|nr:zf-HC2 domain-containing protein [Halomonas anticariensis]EPC01098.1 hypothetical protein L861_11025 [Halomonas anticariensis FP35 = DSM 16096]